MLFTLNIILSYFFYSLPFFVFGLEKGGAIAMRARTRSGPFNSRALLHPSLQAPLFGFCPFDKAASQQERCIGQLHDWTPKSCTLRPFVLGDQHDAVLLPRRHDVRCPRSHVATQVVRGVEMLAGHDQIGPLQLLPCERAAEQGSQVVRLAPHAKRRK